MSHTHRSTSLQGLGTALATLALLIAAGCGETAEPAQVGTTTAPPAPTTGVVTPGAGTPIQPPPEQTAASPVEPPAAATAAADPAPPPIPQQGDAGVHGTVSYRERIALTPGATLTVQLRDTSLMDVASELIAEQVIPNPGQVPISFQVLYESARIDPRNTYSIQARITEADGRLAFINDTAYDVITRGNPTSVDMVLVLVEPPPQMVEGEWSAEDARPVESPVTVTSTEILWEGSDAYVRITFVISEQDGCYRRGREEVSLDGTTVNMTVTAWVPPPTPWAIDCSDETLELDAIAHIAEPLTSGQPAGDVVVGVAAVIAHIAEPLTSGQRCTVAVNGQPTTTFAAP